MSTSCFLWYFTLDRVGRRSFGSIVYWIQHDPEYKKEISYIVYHFYVSFIKNTRIQNYLSNACRIYKFYCRIVFLGVKSSAWLILDTMRWRSQKVDWSFLNPNYVIRGIFYKILILCIPLKRTWAQNTIL